MPFFDINRISIPDRNNINLWADHVERLCLFSDGWEISMDDFKDVLLADNTKTIQQIDSDFSFNHNFLYDLIEHIALQNQNDDEEDDPDSEARDSINSKLIQLFEFINSRQTVFGDSYPFTFQGNVLKLKNRQDLAISQESYLILLLSSELRLYSSQDINILGHVFEAFCKEPFRMVASFNSEVRFFGAGAGHILPADYHGNLHDRILALANDLAFSTNKLIEDPDEIPVTGDAGLDWVGWLNFPDSGNHQPVFLGQCACGSNWVDKQHETYPGRWRNYLEFNQPVNCVHMMPHSFRRTNGVWLQETKIQEVIMLDRLRLLYLLGLADNFHLHEIHTTLLEEALEFQIN